MKKTIISASGFNAAALTRELKAADRLFCRVYNGDERVYVCTGYFAVALQPFEYDELARPVFQRDAGNFFMDRKHDPAVVENDNGMDVRKVLNGAASENVEPLQRAPFIVPNAGIERTGKVGIAFCYEPKSETVSGYNANYFEVFKALTLKAKNAISGAVAYDGDDVVGLLLPVRLEKQDITRSIRAYFTAAPVDVGALQSKLDAKASANESLKRELDIERNNLKSCESELAKSSMALADAQNEVARLTAELEAAKAAAQNAPAEPAETKPTPKTAAEIIAARWTKDGITATVKGASTAAPVVWLAGVNKKQAKEVEAAGGAYSKKRKAYYFRVA